MKTCLIFTLSICFLYVNCQVVTRIFRPGPGEGKGTEVMDTAPDENLAWIPRFDAAAWTNGGIPLIIRSFIEFDLSSIPQNAVVFSAKLSMFCNPESSNYQLQAGENESYLLRVNEAWDDHVVTWNTQPAVSFINPVLIPRSTSNTQHYPDIDVTSHVQDMIIDPAHNFGWQIRLLTEELYRTLQFGSHLDVEQYRPILTIRYKSCNKPMAKWGYAIQQNGIHFIDSSSASCLSWFWEFGDGYSSSLESPAHQYASSGKYRVCLTVTDSCGTDSFCDTVTFCPSMNTSFSSEADGLTVAFTDQSQSALTWFWDFGDDFYTGQQNPTHVFNTSGTYFVCLTTQDNCYTEKYCDSVKVQRVPNPGPLEEQVLLYPIPAVDDLFLEIRNPSSGIINLKIFNIAGSLMFSKSMEKYIPGSVEEINVRNFANGAYILKILMDNKSIVKKFTINR